MPFTREQAYAALASLNPAPVFLESYRTKQLPEELDIYFRPPEEFFLAPESQVEYGGDRLIPLLDNGRFSVVTFLDSKTRELLQLRVETPGEIKAIFAQWEQYLAALMLSIGESVEDDEQLRRISKLVGFPHVEDVLDLFAKEETLDSDEVWETRRLFPFRFPL